MKQEYQKVLIFLRQTLEKNYTRSCLILEKVTLRCFCFCFCFYIWVCFISVNRLYSQLRYKTYQQKQPSWGVLLKTFERSFIIFFIVKVDFKFLQKPRKTNVKDYIICSISRTKPILWNAFSCSNKLLPLRRTYPFYGDEN